MQRISLRERLAAEAPLLLDSAMGTELERRGARSQLPLWSAWALVESPTLVLAIHRDDVEAGADILTSNTFRTHRRTLQKAGKARRSEELTRQAVSLARRAAGESPRPILVAGSLSPLEDCYRPDLVPEDGALWQEHGQQAALLASAGADLILAETHNTVRELVAAVRAAKETGLPVVASVVTDGKGRLLSGEPIEEAARALDGWRPDVLSVNCVPARQLLSDLRLLSEAAPAAPLAAYGNLGPPSGPGGTLFTEEIAPEQYAALAREWLAIGARIVGGCCGTTAAHTAAMRKMIDALCSPPQPISIASP
ncbi:MAG: homocysteine S-methyltransferase family protein [Thermoanaerobaculia bacterium]